MADNDHQPTGASSRPTPATTAAAATTTSTTPATTTTTAASTTAAPVTTVTAAPVGTGTMPAPPNAIQVPTSGSSSSRQFGNRRLSESRSGFSTSYGRTSIGPDRIGVSTSSPAAQQWTVPLSPNLSEAGGRAPSVSSALIDMEQEQEAQVNRLLGVIHWLQAYAGDLQRKLAVETGDPSANVSLALEDVLPRVGRHPYTAPRNMSISRQSSVSSYRDGGVSGRRHSQSIGLSTSPSLAAQVPAAVPAVEPLSASYSAATAAEAVHLRQENDILVARIRDLERQVRHLNQASAGRESVGRGQSSRATGPTEGSGAEPARATKQEE